MQRRSGLNDARSGRVSRWIRGRAPLAVWIVLWLLALAALARDVGTTPLMDPDEGRNAEVAREMAQRGDFVVPHLNGLPYLDKPILFFALAALSIRGLGATELAVRLPALLSTYASVALVVAFGLQIFGRRKAALAGLVLATSPLVVGFARVVIFDSTLMLCASASLFAFYRAWERDGAGWWVAGWAAAGLGVLTKGPIGVALPLLVNLAYAWSCGERARRILHPLGLLVFALVVAPWFFAVAARHPEFPHYAFVRETFERTTTNRMNRTGPPYYFLPLLLGGALPWALVPLSALPAWMRIWRERRGAGRAHAYLLLWIAVPLLFFSLSQSKRPGYILPVFPAVALLCAHASLEWPAARRRAAWMAATLALLGALVVALGMGTISSRIAVPELAAALRAAAPVVCAIFLAAALASAAALRLGSPLALIAGMALVPASIALSANGVLSVMGNYRSERALAETIRAAVPHEIRVVGVGVYPASLAYYLAAEIPVASARGREFKSNYIAEYESVLRERPDSPLRPVDWWREQLRSCSTPTVFVIKKNSQDRADLEARLTLLAEGPHYAAFGPCGEDAP